MGNISPLPIEQAFDPDTVRLLAAVFEDVWSALEGAGIARGLDTKSARDLLAKTIIEAAQAGERDRQKLRHAALEHLARAGANSSQLKGRGV